MNGKLTLYIDQFGQHWWAHTRRELRKQLGGACSKMYREKKDGTAVHCGYVVGRHWCTAYRPVEKPA